MISPADPKEWAFRAFRFRRVSEEESVSDIPSTSKTPSARTSLGLASANYSPEKSNAASSMLHRAISSSSFTERLVCSRSKAYSPLVEVALRSALSVHGMHLIPLWINVAAALADIDVIAGHV